MLADVGRWLEADGRPLALDQPVPIDPEDVVRCLADEGVESEPGDVLLIRTGWLGWYRARSAEEKAAMAEQHANPGLRPGMATARTLWDLHIAAVAADNPAVEVWPPGAISSPEDLQAAMEDRSTMPEIFVHTALIPLLGIPLGEFFVLDALAEDCAAGRSLRVPVHVLTPPPDPGRGVAAERPGHQVAGLLLGRVEVGDDPLDLESGRADPVATGADQLRGPGDLGAELIDVEVGSLEIHEDSARARPWRRRRRVRHPSSTVLLTSPSAIVVTSRVPGAVSWTERTTRPASSRVIDHPRARASAGSNERRRASAPASL